jgi:hypothetical protein
LILPVIVFLVNTLHAQTQYGIPDENTAENMISNQDKKLTIGGYGQVDYNKIITDERTNANLDVHRLVLLFGYKFNSRTTFVTEIEYEHVSEVFVEQAFLNYRINDYFQFRGGLMLIPMGVINELHEPPTFNGVERPNVDKYIVPTTWREIGAGFRGNIKEISIKYQLYIMNGFNGHDGEGNFNGKNGLRGGRQKGMESFMSSPTLSTKLDYYGIPGLKIGGAAYLGKSQSVLYDGLQSSNSEGLSRADSSIVQISMFGLDARYNIKGFVFKGQYIYTSLSNTLQYNKLTSEDVGKTITGYYLELAYNISLSEKDTHILTPFVRYENYDTHASTTSETIKNNEYNRTDITFGLGWKMAQGAVFKADYQLLSNAASGSKNMGQLNIGLGVWF